MKKTKTIGGSIGLLIGVVIAIVALVRGSWQLPLLIGTFAVWGLWLLWTQVLPFRRTLQARRQRERAEAFNRSLAQTLLHHVNYRVSACLKAGYPDVRWEWMMRDPALFVAQGGTGRIRVYGILSQLYYCRKAAELLKPLGILALIVPLSFLADDFMDKAMIREMEGQFSFLGQVGLPSDAFACLGVEAFPTKLQLWQKKSEVKGWTARRYTTQLAKSLPCEFDPAAEAQYLYEQMLLLPKADLEKNKSHVLLELARERCTSKDFAYQTQKIIIR